MAYDRYDTRRSRYPDYDRGDRDRGRDRGFFERAGDEIASWFGDDEAERRRREDERMNRNWGRNRDQDRGYAGYGRDWDRDRDRYSNRAYGRDQDRDRNRDRDRDRGFMPEHGYLRSEYDPDYEDRGGYRPMNWTSSDRDYRSGYRGPGGYGGYDRGNDYGDRNYGENAFGTGWQYGQNAGPGGYAYGAGVGYGSGGYGREYDQRGSDRSGNRDRDEYRRTTYAGDRDRERDHDRHYHSWRQRQMDELDRDYDQYRSENQDRFESDFGNWRSSRQQKRQALGKIREHMEVVGSDGDTIGKVDCVRGDRIVLTKSDSPDDRHHSLDCSMIDTVEGDEVRLDMPAEEAKSRWHDEEGGRGFIGSRDRNQGNVTLESSFSGTYR